MNKIINAPTLELKHEIEQFNQANIDWKVVREKGELNYEFSDRAKAEHLMAVEMLECSLWECDMKTGARQCLEAHKAVS